MTRGRAGRRRRIPLDRAVAALDAGDHRGAVTALVEAWRQRKASTLVDLVERAARRAGARPFADLIADDADTTLARLRAVRKANDPRLATVVIELLRRPRFTAGADDLWELVMTLAAELADPRLVACAEEVHAALFGAFAPGAVRDRVCRRLDHALHQTGVPRAPTSDEVVLEEAVASRLSRTRSTAHQDEAALLDEIYADPAADAPRLVYADLLLERGDPRGELIMLQFKRRDGTLAPEENAREYELLERHLKLWLGPLATVVDSQITSETRFERGFVSVIQLKKPQPDAVRATVGCRDWGLVEYIRGQGAPHIHALAPLRRLREFRGDMAELRVAEARPECFRCVEEVYLFTSVRAPELTALAQTPAFPALRELVIRTGAVSPEVLAALLDSPLARRIQTLALTTLDKGALVPAALRMTGHVPRLRIDGAVLLRTPTGYAPPGSL